jgi:hypothetical protein
MGQIGQGIAICCITISSIDILAVTVLSITALILVVERSSKSIKGAAKGYYCHSCHSSLIAKKYAVCYRDSKNMLGRKSLTKINVLMKPYYQFFV